MMRWRSTLCALAFMGVCVCAPAIDEPAGTPPAAVPSVTTKDSIRTAEGTFTLWRRTPAIESDFGLPLPVGVTADESFVYCLRDRKERNLQRYSRAVFTLPDSLDTVCATYQQALLPDAKRGADKDTGATLLADGSGDDTRFVTLLPLATGCRLTLERAQRFSIPPRVYTADEQRALNMLAPIAQTYASAARVVYSVTESLQHNPDIQPVAEKDALTWAVDFTRPNALSVSAATAAGPRLSITTADGAVKITRAADAEETRPMEGQLTLELVPELQDDPVARLMFGDDLARQADVIALADVPGFPADAQQQLTLTYPEQDTELVLILDIRHQRVLQAETLVKLGDEQARIVRTYTGTTLTPSPAPKAP
jgi:hypothetical protein